MVWYYVKDGERHGPFEADAFQALREDGTLTPETLIWRPGQGDWK
ncbi:MAG: DUF4339 domain-containing protein, partial [Opitutales bacterium]